MRVRSGTAAVHEYSVQRNPATHTGRTGVWHGAGQLESQDQRRTAVIKEFS